MKVVETVFETLYTPYGLRTLEIADEEFHSNYQGEMEERDMAYHQGTVWTFPLGAYYLAYLKVNGYSKEAKADRQRPAGSDRECDAGRLYRTASGNLRRRESDKIQGLFCTGLECR